MRLLVTSDLHLGSGYPERLEALEDVVRIASEESVSYLLIAGDLFDAGVDIDAVKGDVRALFSGNDFQTYVIPGNHDATAFREEDYFGEDIEVLSKPPLEQVDLGTINLLAVPYVETAFSELIDDIQHHHDPAKLNVLLLHGTLTSSVDKSAGEEAEYLPFAPEQLVETGVEYVFAGHIHSSATTRTFANGECVFAYPGSPVSITTKETDRRGVWFFDTDALELRMIPVDSAYYVHELIELSPGEAPDKLDSFRARLFDRDLENATLLVEPVGFIEMPEEEFFSTLESIAATAGAAEYEIMQNDVASARSIVESSLYQSFEQKLEERSDVNDQEVRRMVLQALSREARD